MSLIKCPNCGSLVPDTVRFCHHCGAALDTLYSQKEGSEATVPLSSSARPSEASGQSAFAGRSSAFAGSSSASSRPYGASSATNVSSGAGPERIIIIVSVSVIVVAAIVIGILLASKGGKGSKPESVRAQNTYVEPRQPVVATPEPSYAANRVYSCAYDGFVYIMSAPTYNGSSIIGKFNNGPGGGELLGISNGWAHVRVDGVDGYVASWYIQDKPTVAYSGIVGAEWVVGVWNGGKHKWLKIYGNGAYEYDSYDYGYGYGMWIMQNTELVLRYPDGSVDDVLQINVSSYKLGSYGRVGYVSEQTGSQVLANVMKAARTYGHY